VRPAARWRRRLALLAGFALPLAACAERTGALSAAQEERFTREGVRRRAEDLVFRFTREPGSRRELREDRAASIIVTDSSVLVHKSAKVGLEITPRSRRYYAVERAGDRVRIRSGTGRQEEVWSFVPPDDGAGWAADIRTVIGRSRSAANR
jgi:hypothetical protein